MVGRITGFARPSARPSVCYLVRTANSNAKNGEKTNVSKGTGSRASDGFTYCRLSAERFSAIRECLLVAQLLNSGHRLTASATT